MALGSVNVPGIAGRDAAEAKRLAQAANDIANAAGTAAANAVKTADEAKTAAETAGTAAANAQTAAANAQTAAANAQTAAASAQTAAEKAAQDLAEINQAIEDSGGSIGGGGGNTIKITFEEAFAGAQYTVTDGTDTKTGTVPDGLVVSVRAEDCNAEYIIKATANNGVEYSTSVMTGAYYGQYTATLAVFTATINVTAAAGAEVKATQGSTVFTATAASNGIAAVKVNQSGTYSITATKDGAASNSASVNVTAQQTYTATVKFIRLTVTSPSGSALTLTKGDKTFTKTTTGTDVFYLPSTGTWSGTITKSGETATGSINCAAYQDYTLELAFVKIYGVSWDGTSTTKWTRTDDAAGFTDPVPYTAGKTAAQCSSPFDNRLPWSGMTKSDRTGGVMVAIPKFWYKITQSGKGMKIQIADKATAGFSVSPAHMNRGDGKGERDVVYIGRYHCASDYKSKTGTAPKANITRSAARSGIHALGSNIWQNDFAMRFTLWLLYIVEFADWNTQKTIGKGCGNNSAPQNMGYTDSMPYHTGTTQSNRDTYGLGTQYRNIEGLWDNVLDWCDGCYNNNNGLNIILNPNSFSDSSGGTCAGKPSNGYPSAFSVTTAGGFGMFIPTAASGSETTYSCDYWYFDASYPCVYVGGSYYQNGNRGLFFVNYYAASGAYAGIGSRLQELP